MTLIPLYIAEKTAEAEVKKEKIEVMGKEISVINRKESDYISLTDIARYKDDKNMDDIVKNWLRNRNTIELLGLWEMLHNEYFKPVEFDGFRREAGLNSFTMTPKKWVCGNDWCDRNNIDIGKIWR
jgi:hypothetical protein